MPEVVCKTLGFNCPLRFQNEFKIKNIYSDETESERLAIYTGYSNSGREDYNLFCFLMKNETDRIKFKSSLVCLV